MANYNVYSCIFLAQLFFCLVRSSSIDNVHGPLNAVIGNSETAGVTEVLSLGISEFSRAPNISVLYSKPKEKLLARGAGSQFSSQKMEIYSSSNEFPEIKLALQSSTPHGPSIWEQIPPYDDQLTPTTPISSLKSSKTLVANEAMKEIFQNVKEISRKNGDFQRKEAKLNDANSRKGQNIYVFDKTIYDATTPIIKTPTTIVDYSENRIRNEQIYHSSYQPNNQELNDGIIKNPNNLNIITEYSSFPKSNRNLGYVNYSQTAFTNLESRTADDAGIDSSLIITESNYINDNSLDPSRVSLKLMVLEAETPSKLIEKPNVHDLRVNRLSGRDDLIGRISENFSLGEYLQDRENNMIDLGSTQDTAHQTISVGLNVAGTKPEISSIITSGLDQVNLSSNSPIAAELKQEENHHYFLRKGNFDRDSNWELDDSLVCQIHNCDTPEERIKKRMERHREYYLESQKYLRPGRNIDFLVGTDVLKDVWNNHINAARDISLEIIDVNSNINNKQTIEDNLYKLGLGTLFDPEMKPPPQMNTYELNMSHEPKEKHNNNNEPFNFQHEKMKENTHQYQTVNSQNYNEHHEFQYEKNEESSESLINNFTRSRNIDSHPPRLPDINMNYRPPPPALPANTYPYDVEYYNNYIQDPDLFHLNLTPKLQEELTPPEYIYPHIRTLSTKVGTIDSSTSPKSHLLPPSVLPMIHAEAKEGKIVSNGQQTRIVLRLKPTTGHPNGEVITLPASKFNKFGTAHLTLNNGKQISVRLKRGNTNQLRAESEKESSHLNNFDEMNFIKAKEQFQFGKNQEEIPITILRDGKTGIPIMAIPGLKPSKESVLDFQKQIQPSVPQPFPSTIQNTGANQLPNTNFNGNSNTNFNTNSNTNFNANSNTNFNANSNTNFNANSNIILNTTTGFVSENFNSMRDRLLSRFRDFMKNINGMTRTVESTVTTSFDSSMDFIKLFYDNVLPENYFDDSMTMMSMAAFLAFLGVRASEISSAFTVSSVGKRAISEAGIFVGKDLSEYIENIWTMIINRPSNSVPVEFSDRSFTNVNSPYLFDRPLKSINFNDSEHDDFMADSHENTPPWNKVIEDLELTAQLLNQYLDPLLQSKTRSSECLQRDLCKLSSDGIEQGGFAAFIAPLLSTGISLKQKPPSDVVSALQGLRHLWMSASLHQDQACSLIHCTEYK